MKKEEYAGQFEHDLQFLESEKRATQEDLGTLMCPDYEWEKDVDDYEIYATSMIAWRQSV